MSCPQKTTASTNSYSIAGRSPVFVTFQQHGNWRLSRLNQHQVIKRVFLECAAVRATEGVPLLGDVVVIRHVMVRSRSTPLYQTRLPPQASPGVSELAQEKSWTPSANRLIVAVRNASFPENATPLRQLFWRAEGGVF